MAYSWNAARDQTEKFLEDLQDEQFDESEDEFREELWTHSAPFSSSSHLTNLPVQVAWNSFKLMFPGCAGSGVNNAGPSSADVGAQSDANPSNHIKIEPEDVEDLLAVSTGPDPMELCETLLQESKGVLGREVVQDEGKVGFSDGVQGRVTSLDSGTIQGVRGRGGRGRARSRGPRRGRGRGRDFYPMAEWAQEDKLVRNNPADDVPPEVREKLESVARDWAARERLARQRLERERVASCVKNKDNDDVVLQDFISEFKRLTEDEQFSKFEWKPMGSFSGEREPFMVEHTGPTQYFHGAYQAFLAIWTDDFLKHIASETNRYASSIPRSETKFHAVWYDTNMHEILILFAFWIMFGIIQMPSTASCFSLNPLLQTSVFRLMFNSKRYWALNRALNFSNALPGDSDKLCLLRPVIEHLRKQFRGLYIPDQSICIDEILAFPQYVNTIVVQYGPRTCELCDSATGYLWDFFVLTGQETTSEQTAQKNSETVLKLIRPLLGKGYTLFVDNWFNSLLLTRYLKRNRTDCVGTLRKSCINFPPLLAEQSLNEGSFVARHSDDIVVVTFQDKEQDSLLSTYHNLYQTANAAKPGQSSVHSIITDYNTGKGGDFKDQMRESYIVDPKQNIKWYKKMFKSLLNASIHNSLILVEQSKGKRLNSAAFRLELVEEIIKHHLALKPEEVRRQPFAPTGLDPGRIICNPSQYHGPTKIIKKSNPDNSDERRTTGKGVSKNITNCVYCRVALLKRGRTVYECAKCNVALCLDPCFKLYHTTP